MTNTVKNTV